MRGRIDPARGMSGAAFTLPRPLRALVCRLPEGPPAHALALALNVALARGIMSREAFEPLEGKVVRIEARDAGSGACLTFVGGRFAAGGRAADVTIRACVADFIALALRREDPDTLFFSRRLVIEGNTELGLIAKNALDAVDWARLPTTLAWLSRALERLALH